MIKDSIFLSCPDCKVNLKYKDNWFICCGCSKYYNCNDEISIFSSDSYWGEVSESELKSYVELIKSKGFGYFKNLLFRNRDIGRNYYDFIFNEIRSDWRYCLPINKKWNVLDLGAGMGNATFTLSPLVNEVHAIEKSKLRAEFINLRRKFENKSNIKVYVADVLNLPFPDNSFDLVICNGLLEWVGVTDKFNNPKEAQIYFLQSINKILKPGGYLYIGIENRLGENRVIGGGKDHSGYYFTNLMPRFLANIYMKIRNGIRYQTYTYSKGGYDRLFANIKGFKVLQYYLPYPDYNLPRIITSYSDTHTLKFIAHSFINKVSLKAKLGEAILRLPFMAKTWRLLYLSFIIILQKND